MHESLLMAELLAKLDHLRFAMVVSEETLLVRRRLCAQPLHPSPGCANMDWQVDTKVHELSGRHCGKELVVEIGSGLLCTQPRVVIPHPLSEQTCKKRNAMF